MNQKTNRTESATTDQTPNIQPLDFQQLRWNCDPEMLPFETTAEVDPAEMILGQPAAQKALEFGLCCDAPGQNIYVRGGARDWSSDNGSSTT